MFSTIRVLVLATLAATVPTTLLAQRTLSGTVLDAQGAAVPFAVIELPQQQQGMQADAEGHFSLPLSAGLSLTDSLAVSALGYQRRQFAVPTTPTCTLRLSPLPVALREVVVRSTPQPVQWLGPGNDTQSFGFGDGTIATKGSGWQIARFFRAPEAGFLTKARFFLRADGMGSCSPKTLVQAPIRVRVYAADGPDGSPGSDLLTSSVLASASKAGWLEVDLRAYNLPFPTTGLYVALEWVYTSDRFLCSYQYTSSQTKEKKTATRYGPILGGRFSPDTQTWNYRPGRGWKKFNTAPLRDKLVGGDAAIQAGLQP